MYRRVVNKKYHILKTSDNFYLYKTDIKSLDPLHAGRRASGLPNAWLRAWPSEVILEKLDQLERGFDDIEHRITNIDREHSRYVKATVTRLGYLIKPGRRHERAW